MLQVKVRGFRIELEEVEAVAASHPLVAAAVAAVQDGQLVAHILLAKKQRGPVDSTGRVMRSSAHNRATAGAGSGAGATGRGAPSYLSFCATDGDTSALSGGASIGESPAVLPAVTLQQYMATRVPPYVLVRVACCTGGLGWLC